MKKVLLILLAFASFALSAQNEQAREMMRNAQNTRATRDVSADDIQFWVGEGSNEAVAAFFFCTGEETGVGIAYGYRFDGTATIESMVAAIAEADENFSYTASGSFFNTISYHNEEFNFSITGGNMTYTVSGGWPSGNSDPIVDGDYFELLEWGDCYENLPSDDIYFPEDPNGSSEEDAIIDPEDILYWVGEGENEVVYIVQWCEPEIAFAWGYRFEGNEVTVGDMMNDIAEADSRFSYTGQGTNFVNDIMYVDEEYDLGLHGNSSTWFMYNVNGVLAGLGFEDQTVMDGDVVKFGVTECAIIGGTSWEDMTYTWTTPVTPVSNPNAPEFVDATIDADELLYWIGEGCHEATMIVDWCNDGVALAWGYRFNTDSVTVATMLQTIADADEHFGFSGPFSWLTNLYYLNGNDTAYQISPDYVVYNHNGNYANTSDLEYIFPGDYVKFGAWGCAHNDDVTWASTWDNAITPAPAPAEVGPSDEVFDGPVGSDDCQGIHCQDPAILGWAITCTVQRGPQNIANPTGLASYGADNDAVGEVTESTTSGVVSLGDGGVAVLTFDIPIQNGDGYDFAVFENSLNHTFLELAFVEVSSDGVNYFRFPSVSNTPTDVQIDNNGGVNATHLNNLAGKYLVGWGTPFDLEELAGTEGLDVNNITHIRLVDVVGCVEPRYATRDSRGHIINDPYPTPFASSGFDLAGVGVMNGWRPATAVQEYTDNHLNVYPNPCNDQVTVETVMGEPVMLFNSVGTLVYRTNANDATMILNMSNCPAGLYIVKCGNRAARIVKM